MHISHNGPFGEAIPAGNPHAMSVSLPTIDDVNRLFRDQDPDAWSQLQAMYRRFGSPPIVQQAIGTLALGDEQRALAVTSPRAAERLLMAMSSRDLTDTAIQEHEHITFLTYTPKDHFAHAGLLFQSQITGDLASTRRAEDFLISQSERSNRFSEASDEHAAPGKVVSQLERPYRGYAKAHIANSGMSAVVGAVNAVHAAQNMSGEKKRSTWIRLGNLYSDTNKLFADKANEGIRTITISDATNISAFQEAVQQAGDNLAGILTEAPTNPLLTVGDLEQVRKIAGNTPLLIDNSTAGSMVVDVLPYADMVLESLTKTASGSGDVMAGAVLINVDMPYADMFNTYLQDSLEPLYERDAQRLAYQMLQWEDRVSRAGKNTIRLAEFFEDHPQVARVHWTGSEMASDNYRKIARGTCLPAGLITVEIEPDFTAVYDSLQLDKGPSFGMATTLNTPYVQITHSQDIGSDEDRQALYQKTGLKPNMLRVSVGAEDAGRLLELYAQAFEEAR